MVLVPIVWGQGDLERKYAEVANYLGGEQEAIDDSCYEISSYLNNARVGNNYIFMVNSCQIVYWLSDARYPTRYIHPSDPLKKEYMLQAIDGPGATRLRELETILRKKPEYIIWRQHIWPQPKKELANFLKSAINSDFTIVEEIDNHLIYKRKENINPIKNRQNRPTGDTQ